MITFMIEIILFYKISEYFAFGRVMNTVHITHRSPNQNAVLNFATFCIAFGPIIDEGIKVISVFT